MKSPWPSRSFPFLCKCFIFIVAEDEDPCPDAPELDAPSGRSAAAAAAAVDGDEEEDGGTDGGAAAAGEART